MRILKNNNGNTLILTLLMILVIITLFTSFAFAAVTQQKQVESVDQNFSATAVAEMGVEYFRAAILNEYNRIRNNLPKVGATKDQIELANKKAVEELNSFINNLYIQTKPQKIFNQNNVFFELTSLQFNENKTIAKLEIKGTWNSTSKKIVVDFNVPTNYITPGGQIGSSTTDFNFPNPYPPAGVSQCINNNYEKNKCKTDFNKNFLKNNFNNSTIYFYTTSDYVFDSADPAKDLRNSIFYFNGNMLISNKFELYNYSFFVNGNFKVLPSNNSNKDFVSSNMNIVASKPGSITSFEKINVNLNYSKLYLDTLIVKGVDKKGTPTKMNLNNQSLVCVKSISSSNEIHVSGNSILYYVNGNPKIKVSSGGVVKQLGSEQALISNCKSDWGSNKTSIEIIYNLPLTTDTIINGVFYQ